MLSSLTLAKMCPWVLGYSRLVARVLIGYGDELADVDIKALMTTHTERRSLLTFTVYEDSIPGGTLVYEPLIVENKKRLVNIGYVVVEPVCWELLRPEDGVSDWINRVFRKPSCRVAHYIHTGKRATVNSLADLKYAEDVRKGNGFS